MHYLNTSRLLMSSFTIEEYMGCSRFFFLHNASQNVILHILCTRHPLRMDLAGNKV